MRIRGAKTELEEAGLETEGMVDSTAKLRQEIIALSGVDIMEADGKTFKSTYGILDELAQKWEDLSDIQQATITELIAGKRQGNIISSLMNNFDTARDALETSLNSAGSAMAEHEKWQKSLEAQINSLKASWQSLSQSFLNSDFLKVVLNVVIALVDALDKLVSSFGTLGTLSLGVGIWGFIKNLGNIKSFASLAKEVGSVSTAFTQLGGAASLSASAIVGGVAIIGAAIALAYNSYKKYREELEEARQETIKASDEFLEASTSFEKAYIKYSGKTNLTAEEEEELASAIDGTVSALDDKTSSLESIVNASGDYVASLEAIADAEIKAAKDAAKRKRDAAEESLKENVIGWSKFDGSEVDIGVGYERGTESQKAVQIAKELQSDFLKGVSDRSGYRYSFELSTEADTDEILDYYYTLLEYKQKLEDELSEDELADNGIYDNVTNTINDMSGAIETYTSGVYEYLKASEGIPKTTEDFVKMREAILSNEELSHLSADAKLAFANMLDSDYKSVFDLSSVEVQARKLVGVLDEFGETEVGEVETFLNIKTSVNNGECSVGEYLSSLDDIENMTANWDDKSQKVFDSVYNIDADSIKSQYDNIYKYISRQDIDWFDGYEFTPEFRIEKDNIKDQEIRKFLNDLTANELAAVIDIKTEIDWENTSTEKIRKQIEDRVKLNKALSFETNIEVDTTALEALNTALDESASAIGLSEESIDSLKSKYSDLEGYNPHTLFEKTANGVKVNREELEKLEKKYNDLTKTEVQEHLDTLVEEYNKCTKAIDGNIGVTEKLELINKRDKYAQQIEELAEYQAQLEGVTGAYQRWLDAQNAPEDYEGYEKVATSREDIKDEISRGFLSNSTKEYIDLLSGEDLVGGTIDDYANAWEKLDKKVGSTSYSIHDFFTVNDDGDITSTGIDRFFKGLQQDFKGEVAKFNEKSGQWEYDFSQENLKKIQDEWGIGIEAIELLLEAAAAAGYDVDWGGIFDDLDLDTSNFESLVAVAEQAQKELNKLEGYEDLDFNFSTTTVEAATSELEKAQKTYNELVTGEDGKININAKGADQARIILATLLVQKQQLEDSEIAINISTSGLDDAQAKAVAWVQDFRTKYKNLEIAISTGEGIKEAKTELETVKTSLGELDGDTAKIAAQLVLGEGTNTSGDGFKTQVNNAIDSIGKQDINVGFKLDETAISDLNSNLLSNFTVDATAKITNVDKSQLETVETGGMVNWTENTDGVSKSFEADGTVNWYDNIKNLQTSFSANGTVKWTSGNKVKVKVISEANGTANANGSASGRAFARGNWGIKGSGVALGGELGQELVVRDGKFFTIGDTSAEFFHYKPNDIVFNAAQTESLFKYGGIKGAKPRGTMLASGTAFAEGSTSSSGKAFAWNATSTSSKFAKNRLQQVTADGDKGKSRKSSTKTKTKTKGNSVTTEIKTTFDSNVQTSANVKTSDFANQHAEKDIDTKDQKEFEEVFDWIETAISRIEREIDNLDRTANSAYKSWSERNKALASEISKVSEEIKLQKDAASEYLKEANSVGLDESWAKKVRNGTLDISTLNEKNSSEELIEKIKNYQKWYELYLDCIDAAEELREEESKLYAQRFENVQSRYDDILQGFEHTESMLNEYINQAEAKGHIVSKNYYNALIDNEKQNIDTLKHEQAELIAERDKAVAEGKITKGSEAWYEQCEAIDSVTQAIEEGNTALIEYANSIRDIEWEVFDLIQERISDVTAEADFLIELMSNKDLFDDNGKFTEQGVATVGLHAQNYNTYMYQADEYAKEVSEIDKQLAKGYSKDLEDRRRELIGLQRDMILAAEDEKNVIRDLVEEGIEFELEALDERIQKYQDALDAQKDLYDYQKRVEEQTKEISSLQKQISAYEGDNSEEAKAKIQELRVSLEEAEADLEETEYDKYISDQQKLLDALYTEYESLLNERLDNTDALIVQQIAAVNENASTISNTLSAEANNVGATISDAMNNIWNSGEHPVLTMYGEGFQNKQTTTNSVLSGIKISVDSMVASLNKEAAKKTTANKTSTSAQKNPTTTTNKNNSNTANNTSSNSNKITEDTLKSIAAAIWVHGSKAGWEDDPTRKNKLSAKLGAANAKKVQEYINKYGANGELYRYWYSNNKSLDKYKYSAFKFGAKKIDESQLAWTQEAGQEYIVRPSDGAILTPVAKGDSVLTAQASNNIWQMANSPAEFIKDNLNLGSASVPNNSTVQNSYTQHIDSVVFRMDNVKNYEQLLSAMQKDKNFERLITAMTIDKLSGGSSLAKGKAIR